MVANITGGLTGKHMLHSRLRGPAGTISSEQLTTVDEQGLKKEYDLGYPCKFCPSCPSLRGRAQQSHSHSSHAWPCMSHHHTFSTLSFRNKDSRSNPKQDERSSEPPIAESRPPLPTLLSARPRPPRLVTLVLSADSVHAQRLLARLKE